MNSVSNLSYHTHDLIPGAINSGEKSTNVAGKMKYSVRINEPPYVVTDCDQVLLVPGKDLLNLNDFTQKKEAFFTLNAYMINVFESQNSNKLINSILLSDVNIYPFVLQGSKNCLMFKDEIHKKQISMCLEDPKILKEIKVAFNALFICSYGYDRLLLIIQRLIKIYCDQFEKLNKQKNSTVEMNKYNVQIIFSVFIIF